MGDGKTKIRLLLRTFFPINISSSSYSFFSYDWNPSEHKMFCVSVVHMCIITFFMLYTQYTHFHNGDYMRNLEIVALYGLLTSVGVLLKD